MKREREIPRKGALAIFSNQSISIISDRMHARHQDHRLWVDWSTETGRTQIPRFMISIMIIEKSRIIVQMSLFCFPHLLPISTHVNGISWYLCVTSIECLVPKLARH